MPRFVSAILCLVALTAADAGQAANPAFRISIDADTWRKFGWRYPVTYVFHLPAGVQELMAGRRDGSGDPWTPLASKPRGESFNGVECFRHDPEAKRIYVSVGFNSSPTIHLEFSGTEKVEFVEIARYYREDVAALDAAFEEVDRKGQIFYAMWHPDRYRNSVIHDARPPVEGVQGSSLIRHLGHVARRKDVWYVANGWLHCCRYVAEHAQVERQR